MNARGRSSLDPPVLLALLALGLIWGFSFVLIKTVVRETGPLLLACMRVWIAALCLLPVVLLKGRRVRLGAGRVRDLVLVSVLNFSLPYFLIPRGELAISTGQASILNATMPFFTVLAGWLIWGRRPRLVVITGVAVGFAGVAVMAGDAPGRLTAGWFIGAGAVLLAAILYAVAALIFQHRFADLDPLTLTFLCLAASGITLLPAAALARPSRLLHLTPPAAWALVALGTACTALAYLFFFFIIGRAGATVASLSTYLFTAFALFWGWLFFNEDLGWESLAGTLLVFAGIWMAGRGGGAAGRKGEGERGRNIFPG